VLGVAGVVEDFHGVVACGNVSVPAFIWGWQGCNLTAAKIQVKLDR
jgi:hypothetical protein